MPNLKTGPRALPGLTSRPSPVPVSDGRLRLALGFEAEPANHYAEPTTTRVAWDKVRDDLEREANTQQAFVDSLDHDVIKPLTTLKESKDERRRRIEENLKRSAALYADHAENKISKFQQVYLKKYHPHQHARSTYMSQRPEDSPNKSFGGKISALFRGRWEDLRDPEPPKPSTSEEGTVNFMDSDLIY
ncbi:hypothetical protein EDB89DRAFT_390186 [Lactarius sanguifluus]|nr:hypothetical protein EDB89DRAFT_390186 [Lactarius sanguifluus]